MVGVSRPWYATRGWLVVEPALSKCRSLLTEGFLDELRLMVHPIVVSSGKRLFEDGGDRKALELVDSKTFSTGVVYLTYRPAHG